MKDRVINSAIDTDFYKISMGSVALFGNNLGVSYSDIIAEYDFINRGNTVFPPGFDKELVYQVEMMSELTVSDDDIEYLAQYPFLRKSYLSILKHYRYDPDQVYISQNGGDLRVKIIGPWWKSIYWEVPLLALISELYYNMTGQKTDAGWKQRAEDKAILLNANGVSVADFGTRRRYSFDVQDFVVKTFRDTCKSFVGTSNVFLAKKYGIKSIGTQAHEFISIHAALFGYRMANQIAMEAWVNEFGGDLGIALPDTFTTDVFLKSFDKKFARLFDGCRQDSNSSYEFADKLINHYKSLGIDPKNKVIVFSDALNSNKCVELHWHYRNLVKTSFGVGTHLTADVGVEPLNIVIKVTAIEYNGTRFNAIKLSDVQGKETGDPEEIKLCKKVLKLT